MSRSVSSCFVFLCQLLSLLLEHGAAHNLNNNARNATAKFKKHKGLVSLILGWESKKLTCLGQSVQMRVPSSSVSHCITCSQRSEVCTVRSQAAATCSIGTGTKELPVTNGRPRDQIVIEGISSAQWFCPCYQVQRMC